jgi:hypothetical protein
MIIPAIEPDTARIRKAISGRYRMYANAVKAQQHVVPATNPTKKKAAPAILPKMLPNILRT